MRTPILVGAGQYCQRELGADKLFSAVDLGAVAAKEAIKDSQADCQLAAQIDTIVWTRTFSDSSPKFQCKFGGAENPPRSVAQRLGAAPERAIHGPVGGNTPQKFVNEMATKIANHEVDVALLVGAEAIANEVFALKNDLTPNWQETVGGACDDRGLGLEDYSKLYEIQHGVIDFMPLTYSLFENAIRHKLGHTNQQHRQYMADLMKPFVEVAARNPFAMFTNLPSHESLSASENLITTPYSKDFCAREKVNQAAAVVLTSVETARKLGIPESNWVYIHGGIEVSDKTIVERENYHSSAATKIAAAHLFSDLNLAIEDIKYFDIYSCFPSAVEGVLDGLGINLSDPRSFTLTGGLPYFGGPGNNYSMHAIAEMVARLRIDREAFGLVSANGGFLSKQALGVYSAKVPSSQWRSVDKSAIAKDMDEISSPEVIVEADGKASIETYAVSFTKNKPTGAVVIARLLEGGGRCLARVSAEDELTLDILQTDEVIGKTGTVRTTDELNIFSILKD